MSNLSENEMKITGPERCDADRNCPEFVGGSQSLMGWIRIAERLQVLDARLDQETDASRGRLLFDLLGQERCI